MSRQPSLFPEFGPRRSPNATAGHAPPGVVLRFSIAEFHTLKHNSPGPSGGMGGYQNFENRLIDLTDYATLQCHLTPEDFERLVRYVKKYGSGGPNNRIRAACIPALRRLGIDLGRTP